MSPLPPRGWLEPLLEAELDRYDPAAARARLPLDVRMAAASPTDLAPAARLLVARSLRHRRLDAGPGDPSERFLDDVRLHVGLTLDLAALRREPFVRANQRAELAAILAAAAGEGAVALAVAPELPGGTSARAVARAIRATEAALHARFFPPGDPVSGLPLHPGAVAVLRRRLARVAMGYLREGRLVPEALARHGAYAAEELALLAEALAGLLLAAAPADAKARAMRLRQLGRLGLPRAEARAARHGVQTPRAPAALAEATPERVRPFLLEELLLAQLRAKLSGEGATRFVEAYAAAARLDPQVLAEVQVEAAAQHGDHQVWFEVFGEAGAPLDWQALAEEWEAVADHVVERVSSAVTGNLGAMAKEIRETGELGGLLAKAASGRRLDAAERRKVKAQLIDLAKAVPALAIFAAPGGMLLLPLLAKLLPFNLLPSAWDKAAGTAPRAAEPASPARGVEPAAEPVPPARPKARGRG